MVSYSLFSFCSAATKPNTRGSSRPPNSQTDRQAVSSLVADDYGMITKIGPVLKGSFETCIVHYTKSECITTLQCIRNKV